MSNFHNVNLPKYIEIFAVSTTEFSTFCAVTKSGREMRSSNSSQPKRSYLLQNCHLSKVQFEGFNDFFYARNGKKFAFRLKDFCDSKVVKQLIGRGDDELTEFQLIKIYKDSIAPYTRKIINPTAETIQVYLGEELVVPGAVDLKTGIVTLAEAVADEVEVFASFEFDVLVRFENDSYQYSFNEDGTISLDNVKLIEVV
jgi:uncharacterized protein (TIGR02217 family)